LAGGLVLCTATPVLGATLSVGAAATPAQLTAMPSSINFGSITLGDLSTPTTVTLTNTGGTTDTLTGDTYGGKDPDDFLAYPSDDPSNNCTVDDTTGVVTIPPAGTCDLIVAFLPGAVGNRSAAITLTDSGTTPVVISVQGVGTEGYYETSAQGAVSAFGDAQLFGDASGSPLKAPIVGISQTGDDGGYWLVAADGGVFSFGDASFFGSTGALNLNKPIVGMAPTLDDGGYWLVASDGGIFSFGDAPYYGSTGGTHLNKPIVGMAITPDSGGYWLVASDGGIFSFGDAQFYGSTGATHLNKPIVGMAATPDGGGYWLVASDGGIFSFGDAPYYGSTGGGSANAVGIATSGTSTLQASSDSPAVRATNEKAHFGSRVPAGW
jgi:hypothetical protein